MNLPVVIRYSAGTSSEWMLRAIEHGLIARPEHIAVEFANVGSEHEWSYEHKNEVEAACQRLGIDFLQAEPSSNLEHDLLTVGERTRLDQPPFFIAKGHGRGRIEHRCTKQYKVAPMRREISTWLAAKGLLKRCEVWIGYAADEAHRVAKTVGKQDVQWERLRFPVVEMGVSRARQRADLVKWTGRAPRFSMCIFCPFKSPERWRQTSEADLKRAIAVDEAIRDLDCIGITDGPAYLTDRLIPISDLVRKGDPQPNLPGLESYCDGGHCFL